MTGSVVGLLRCRPGTLPRWLDRSRPHFVPVRPSELRPTRTAAASIDCHRGQFVLIDVDGDPTYDLDVLERALAREEWSARGRPVDAPKLAPAIRDRLARMHHAYQRFRGWPAPPLMSFGADAVHALNDYVEGMHSEHPWPKGKRSALVITHDVERASMNSVLELARLEASLGLRAVYFLVPALWGGRRLVSELIAMGHEVAVHGIDHSDRDRHATPSTLAQAARSLGLATAAGYRSPHYWCDDGHASRLVGAFLYDSSRPDTRFARSPRAWSGCGTVFPFLDECGLLQIPPTVPSDLELLDAGYSWGQIRVAWRAKCELIREAGGLALISTHLPSRSAGLTGAIEELAQREVLDSVWQGTGQELAAFLLAGMASHSALRPWLLRRPRTAHRRVTAGPKVPIAVDFTLSAAHGAAAATRPGAVEDIRAETE